MAKTVIQHVISTKAVEQHNKRRCQEIIADLPHGKILRWLAIAGSKSFLEPAMALL